MLCDLTPGTCPLWVQFPPRQSEMESRVGTTRTYETRSWRDGPGRAAGGLGARNCGPWYCSLAAGLQPPSPKHTGNWHQVKDLRLETLCKKENNIERERKPSGFKCVSQTSSNSRSPGNSIKTHILWSLSPTGSERGVEHPPALWGLTPAFPRTGPCWARWESSCLCPGTPRRLWPDDGDRLDGRSPGSPTVFI